MRILAGLFNRKAARLNPRPASGLFFSLPLPIKGVVSAGYEQQPRLTHDFR
jgi:hypothetical protein